MNSFEKRLNLASKALVSEGRKSLQLVQHLEPKIHTLMNTESHHMFYNTDCILYAAAECILGCGAHPVVHLCGVQGRAVFRVSQDIRASEETRLQTPSVRCTL
ncbi:hypothetical protein NQZ68_040243 [Dissostichus eleginoides]|nr:hypothetical protein NQZ68_040243 [Dissostichus eleginoides]